MPLRAKAEIRWDLPDWLGPNARAHRPTHGLFQPASLGGETAEFFGPGRFFLTDPLG